MLRSIFAATLFATALLALAAPARAQREVSIAEAPRFTLQLGAFGDPDAAGARPWSSLLGIPLLRLDAMSAIDAHASAARSSWEPLVAPFRALDATDGARVVGIAAAPTAGALGLRLPFGDLDCGVLFGVAGAPAPELRIGIGLSGTW